MKNPFVKVCILGVVLGLAQAYQPACQEGCALTLAKQLQQCNQCQEIHRGGGLRANRPRFHLL